MASASEVQGSPWRHAVALDGHGSLDVEKVGVAVGGHGGGQDDTPGSVLRWRALARTVDPSKRKQWKAVHPGDEGKGEEEDDAHAATTDSNTDVETSLTFSYAIFARELVYQLLFPFSLPFCLYFEGVMGCVLENQEGIHGKDRPARVRGAKCNAATCSNCM